jgi:hypothetical protein
MNKAKIVILTTCAALGGMVIGNLAPAQAQFGGLFRGAATIAIVDKLSGQIDRVVNDVTGNKTNNVRESTRVVPILSIGQGTYAGAVQVTGPKNLVDKVKAVAQLTVKKRIGTDVQITAMIPVSTRSVTDIGSIARVKGVGVSAIIDIKL